MAKPPAETSSAVPATVDASLFAGARAEAMIEAGILPYFTQDDKDLLSDNGTPLFILGVRKQFSKKLGKDFYELSITTDLTNARKGGVWGGLPTTEYWQAMAPRIEAMLEHTADGTGIGPVFAHSHEYTNQWGTFTGYDFRETAQSGSDGNPVGATGNSSADDGLFPPVT